MVVRKKPIKLEGWVSGQDQEEATQIPAYRGPGRTKEAGICRYIRIRFQRLRPCALKYTHSMPLTGIQDGILSSQENLSRQSLVNNSKEHWKK